MSHNLSRQSNMELLRIISMVFIMVIHADFYSIPYSIPRWFILIGADAGVNCFVLISGYFGIHPKIKSFSSFIFQIFFFIFVGNLISIWRGSPGISYDIVRFSWFIRAYVALYVFAPILNTFAENATKRQFLWFLVLWAIVEFVMGYTVDYLKFERGYSFQAFILLYMVARYIKIHGGKVFSLHRRIDLLLFVIFTMMSAILMSGSEMIGKAIGGNYYFRAYNSPLMILASIFFMLYFSKIEIQSKIINIVGRSAYAAFLFHCVIYDWYRGTCHSFYQGNHYILGSIYTILLIAVLFTIAILLDQIRIVIWDCIIKCIVPLWTKGKGFVRTRVCGKEQK